MKLLNKNKFQVLPAKNSLFKAIIFDMGDVLFKTAQISVITSIIKKTKLHPALLYYLATSNIKDELFSILKTVPSLGNQKMYHKGHEIPPIMIDWITGLQSCENILTSSIDHIIASKQSNYQKKLFTTIVQQIFNPQALAESQKPIKSMIKLLQPLKDQQYQIYILSNWDHESFSILKRKYQKIFTIFDGILISGTEEIGKPNPSFYNKLLLQYNLVASECIFIDDEPCNLTTADQLGITPVLKKSSQSVYKALENKGIIKLL